MATIGYGDLTPNTSIGVIIGAFLSLAGIVILSLLVSSLTDLFSLSYREKRSLTLLNRLKKKD
jgi:hypothetical protein